MKTRNAFCLRDFDEERILQRPYFKDFGFDDKPDEEILKSLIVSETDSIDDSEKKLSKIEKVWEKLADFHNFIVRHLNRFGRYKFHKTKPQRNDEIVEKYFAAEIKCAELATKSGLLYDATDKRVKKKYRQIFTENLRKYRKAAGLTQKELGELVQVSPQGMSHYATGIRDMPLYTLARIAKILGVSTDKLLGIT